MKIPGGSSPYVGIYQPQKTSKTKKTKKSTKKSSVKKARSLEATEAANLIDQLESLDSPIYDVMADASKKLENGEADLEEATLTIVSAMIREQLGRRNLSEETLKDISQTVSSSISGDQTMSNRLENILRNLFKIQKQQSSS